MIQTNILQDNVEVELYAIDQLRELIPGWEDLPTAERLERLEAVDPVHEFSSHNVITQTYREHLRDLIDPESATQTAIDVTHMAFGDDGTAPSPSDTHLVNEVYRDQIDDHVAVGDDEVYKGTLLIGSDDAVGLDLIEAALVSESDPGNADDMAANRVILDDPDARLQPKDSDHAVTVRIELSYLDESEVA